MKKKSVYDRLKKAYRSGHGLRLSAEDVDKLMSDTAIHDAVMQTYEGEPS